MSGGIGFAEASATLTGSDDPHLIEVVAPIESETKDATLREIRGNVPGDRATLEGLSNALDDLASANTDQFRRRARIAAIIYG